MRQPIHLFSSIPTGVFSFLRPVGASLVVQKVQCLDEHLVKEEVLLGLGAKGWNEVDSYPMRTL
jgi:hypothetical protein